VRAPISALAGQSNPFEEALPASRDARTGLVYWNCKGREDTSQVRDLSMEVCLSKQKRCVTWTRRSG